jgi:hypothetical protein
MVTVGHHSFGTSVIWSTSSVLNGGAILDTNTGGRHHYAGLAFDVWALTATAALAGTLGAFFHRVFLEREGHLNRLAMLSTAASSGDSSTVAPKDRT